MSFIKLADQFRQLRRDPLTDELGTESVRTLEAQAARVYRKQAEQGRAGFRMDVAKSGKPYSSLIKAARQWEKNWQIIRFELAMRHEYQDRLPAFDRIGGMTGERPKDDGAYGYQIGFDKSRWRQRADDNAAVCEILAELAGEVNARPGDKNEDSAKPSSAANDLGDWRSADWFRIEHGVRQSRLSEQKVNIPTRSALPGTVDSQGKKVRTLYHLPSAIRVLKLAKPADARRK